jgi:hypothetical protein
MPIIYKNASTAGFNDSLNNALHLFYYLVDSAPTLHNHVFVGETYQINSTTDVWCRSQKVIPLGLYYKGIFQPSPTTCGVKANNFQIYGRSDWKVGNGLFSEMTVRTGAIRFACEPVR